MYNAVDIIRAKRDGGRLEDEAIRWLITSYLRGEVSDEQMSALLMAIYFRGLDAAETATLTATMLDSGDRVDLSSLDRPTVDKHSTGGVGDKISLPLVPLVAACGAAVPQMAGRALGHTGGTLDKMESYPGWRFQLTAEEVRAQLREVGGVICGQGPTLVPADRRLYALRDVTGTVESIPLIAASIMSKKLAEGTANLVLDVKVGKGAFMGDLDRARELARTLVDIGSACQVRTRALLTAMDAPLGYAVGNAIEVEESLAVLAGGGPADVRELTLALAREMLDLAGLPEADPERALADGSAMDVWRRMLRAQGADPDVALPRAEECAEVRADSDGHITMVDARQVARSAWLAGAGRERKEDAVDLGAGVLLRVRPGEVVHRGDLVANVYGRADKLDRAVQELSDAFEYGESAVPAGPLILDRIG